MGEITNVQSMIIKVGEGKFSLPIAAIRQSFKAEPGVYFSDPNGNEMVTYKEHIYNIARLSEYLNISGAKDIEEGILMLTENKRRLICMLADELIEERMLEINPLPKFYENSDYLCGCTLLESGEISLALNMESYFEGVEEADEDFFEKEEAEAEVVEEVTASKGEDTTKDKYFTFELMDLEYGIDIGRIKEIVGVPQTFARVPGAPHYSEGIMSLRGQFVPMLCLRKKFGMPSKEYDEHTCVVVVEDEENSIGLIVDRVSEVLIIKEEDIEPAPKAKADYYNQFVKGIGKVGDKTKLLLDFSKIVE